jgi:hypothetical protein
MTEWTGDAPKNIDVLLNQSFSVEASTGTSGAQIVQETDKTSSVVAAYRRRSIRGKRYIAFYSAVKKFCRQA